MWPYWFLFLIPSCFSLIQLKSRFHLSQKFRRNNLPLEWRFIFLLLVLMIGFRHEVGGDWFSYINNLRNLQDVTIGASFLDIDPGFSVIYWLAIKTGFDIYFVNILSAIIFSWGLIAFCRSQKNSWLALTVAVPYLITVVSMGYTRQSVAIGVAMFAMIAIGRGRVLRFLFLIAIATTFHKSALILIPFALISKLRRRISFSLLILFIGIILYIFFVKNSLDVLIDGYIEQGYESSGTGIRLAMNALPASLFLIFKNKFQISSDFKSFWSAMAWTALLLVGLFTMSTASTALDRIALYWIPLQIFVLSNLPNAIKKNNITNPKLVFITIAYSGIVHFAWLTYADTAFAWLPYQFYPLEWFLQ